MKKQDLKRGAVNAEGAVDEAATKAPASDRVFPLLVDEKTAAEMLGLSPYTLQKWRNAKPQKGPKPLRVEGKAVRYRLPDLLEYVNAQVALAEIERGEVR